MPQGDSLFSSLHRRVNDAATRYTRTVSLLLHARHKATSSEIEWLVGYEAETLLRKVLYDADSLVGLLNDDAGEDIERHAEMIFKTLRARRIAAKLEQVEGRMPEEAEAFQAKARELRGE